MRSNNLLLRITLAYIDIVALRILKTNVLFKLFYHLEGQPI